MAKIQFSQDLIKHLALYLGMSLGEIAKLPDFPYSKPLLYKVADGSIPVSDNLNDTLNKFWDDRELDSTDLENIYKLVDLLAVGNRKEKEYQVKQYKTQQQKGSK